MKKRRSEGGKDAVVLSRVSITGVLTKSVLFLR